MKKIIIAAVFVGVFGMGAVAQTVLKTYLDSVSYALGLDIAQNLVQNNLDKDMNSKALSQGIQDGMAQNNYKIHPEQARLVAQGYFMKMQQAQREEENKKYSVNIEAGKKFLEENKKKPNVKVTPSGLQYMVIKEGTGPKASPQDQVTLHYEGSLINGTVFDSSVKRGEPVTFGVTQVIPGFSEAIQLMSVGSKYVVYIPQELAYGDRNMGTIEPYSTLIFEIEIFEIPTQAKEQVAGPTQDVKTEDASKSKKSKK